MESSIIPTNEKTKVQDIVCVYIRVLRPFLFFFFLFIDRDEIPRSSTQLVSTSPQLEIISNHTSVLFPPSDFVWTPFKCLLFSLSFSGITKFGFHLGGATRGVEQWDCWWKTRDRNQTSFEATKKNLRTPSGTLIWVRISENRGAGLKKKNPPSPKELWFRREKIYSATKNHSSQRGGSLNVISGIIVRWYTRDEL